MTKQTDRQTDRQTYRQGCVVTETSTRKDISVEGTVSINNDSQCNVKKWKKRIKTALSKYVLIMRQLRILNKTGMQKSGARDEDQKKK